MIGTLIRVTLRSLLNRRRTLWLALLGALVVGIAAIFRIADPDAATTADFSAGLLADFGIGVILPLVAVIVGTAAIGSELEDGTIIYLLARPVPRLAIVATKGLVSWLLTSALVAIPIFVAGVVAAPDGVQAGLAHAVAAVIGALEYTAIFMALSLATSRALVIGLAYVIVWEGIVGGLFAGTRVLSVRQHVLAIAELLGGGSDAVRPAQLEPAVALVMTAVVSLLAGAIAVRLLERVELRGETA